MNHKGANCLKRSKQPVQKAATTRKSTLAGCSRAYRVTHVTLPSRVMLTHVNLTFEGRNPLIHWAFYEWSHSTKWDPSSTWMTASRSKHEEIRGRKKTEIMVHFCRFNKSSIYFHKGASVALLTKALNPHTTIQSPNIAFFLPISFLPSNWSCIFMIMLPDISTTSF